MTRTIATFRRIARTFATGAEAGQQTEGRRVVGYFCLYTPPEIILAAGASPFRLHAAGSEDSSSGDAWMSGRICTFVRHVASLALDGRLDFLGGVVCANTCDHVRRATDLFAKKTGIPFVGFVSVPRNPRESLLPYYRQELANLYQALCALDGILPTDEALRQAIRTLESVRTRLRTVQGYRTRSDPRISGADAFAVHVAAQILPPHEFCRLADELLAELETAPPLPVPRARLMLLGGELDDPEYIDAIESQGALVVDDLLCFGARSAPSPIDADAADPLDAIARGYFFRPSCARMIGAFGQRYDELARSMQRCQADGAVFTRLLFCDPWGADAHNIAGRIKRAAHATTMEASGEIPVKRAGVRVGDADAVKAATTGTMKVPGPGAPTVGGKDEVEAAFPALFLTREYGIVPTGQLKTRIQAFIEKIEIARLQRRDGNRRVLTEGGVGQNREGEGPRSAGDSAMLPSASGERLSDTAAPRPVERTKAIETARSAGQPSERFRPAPGEGKRRGELP
ncbi:MAG: 2-hydroxyacyl-CoA dehydratase [Bradymonadales bacterium]|nr:2-hydroxyacyl-CoA dehydratase [Bradymonadales bacterium]